MSPSSKLPIRVTPAVEAMFGLDGGAMFGIIPRPIWDRTNPADAMNRIDLACRCLIVEYADGTKVLVDVGIGSQWSEKERGIYNINTQDDALSSAMSKQGFAASNVDHVILTHLHFDHAGGLGRLVDGKVQSCFPNATHWVQRRNWSWAHAPSARDGGSYRKADWEFLAQEGAPPMELVDGISEILPGIEVLPVHGHTFGMQVVKIRTEDTTYIHLADLIPTTSHLREPYVMGYDLQPLVTLAEKREMLYHAAREDWVLVFEHDPTTPMGRVEFDARGRPTLIPS